jgi:hypothetical protein
MARLFTPDRGLACGELAPSDRDERRGRSGTKRCTGARSLLDGSGWPSCAGVLGSHDAMDVSDVDHRH